MSDGAPAGLSRRHRRSSSDDDETRAAGEDPRTHVADPPSSAPIGRAVAPRPVRAGARLDTPALYFNRELSWIDFNWRVLAQALDARNPLLERVRFLAIVQSNLDEFFRKRVGGLRRQEAVGVTRLSPDGRTPARQLDLIREAVGRMQEAMSGVWRETLRPLLRAEGIVLRDYEELSDEQRQRMHRHFMDQIYPVLTPLAVDPGHPFPFISNLSLSLAITLRHPHRDGLQFARVKVPFAPARWIELDEPTEFLPLEQLVARHVDELFPGATIESVHAFRVTRNADLRREEEEAEDLLQMISEELRERRFAAVVRLEVEREMPPRVVDLLQSELGIGEEETERIDGPLDLSHLGDLSRLNRPDLLFPAWEPGVPARFHPDPPGEPAGSVFQILARGEALVHHPYDSFAATVQRLLEEAAADPAVLAIKMTLYRTSENSPVVHTLVRAAEQGKQVAVLVEVTARFEEERNIEWGQMLERAGVHVTYGLVGLKTHAKVALIVRKEQGRIRTYAHIGTGNYHTTTARTYSDLGLLTADPAVGFDLIRLFHYLTGHAPEQRYRSLVVAPRDLRPRLEDLIRREIEHHQSGRGGRIIFKMNALDDPEMIRVLYEASQAGVAVDLIVRGHCRLRPGIEGISDNIRVVSIVGRFLEHDRVYYLENAGEPEVFIGSADLRTRNLEERVEALVPIEEAPHRERLHRVLSLALDDNRLAWDLQPDGAYLRRTPAEGDPVRDYHGSLMEGALERREATLRGSGAPGLGP